MITLDVKASGEMAELLGEEEAQIASIELLINSLDRVGQERRAAEWRAKLAETEEEPGSE